MELARFFNEMQAHTAAPALGVDFLSKCPKRLLPWAGSVQVLLCTQACFPWVLVQSSFSLALRSDAPASRPLTHLTSCSLHTPSVRIGSNLNHCLPHPVDSVRGNEAIP